MNSFLQARSVPRWFSPMITVPEHALDPRRPTVGPGDPAALAVREALAEGHHWLERNAPRAAANDPEGVHHLRTTTRRLRSALRLFADLVDREWADALAAELRWLAETLGAVRDLDVLTDRLVETAGALGEDAATALNPLFESLHQHRREASEALRIALRGPRYAALAARLAEAAVSAPTTTEARAPCREVLPPLVAVAWKSLRHAGRALEPSSPEEAFHAVRKKAKRARYAAEAVAPALDPDASRAARRFARKARRVQDTLGAHQDATIAAALIREAAAHRPELGPFNFAAGRLIEREARAASEARTRFFQVWRDLDRKKPLKWLRV